MKIGEGTLTREAKKTSTNLKIEQRDKKEKNLPSFSTTFPTLKPERIQITSK